MQEKFVLKSKKVIKRLAAFSMGVAMLASTVSGALTYDLAKYPAPFVVGGAYDPNNVFVVGSRASAEDTLGMVDVATKLQFESKTCTRTSSNTVSVAGGTSETIPLGSAIADPRATTLDIELRSSKLAGFIDGVINFQSKEYDVSESLILDAGANVTAATALSSAEDDYKTNVFMEVERNAIKYFYKFDESINVSKATTTDPLEIKFLGKTLKITAVTISGSTAGTEFTANVGTEYFMSVDDTVNVDVSGVTKKVTLKNVGTSSAVLDVDGKTETISSGSSKTVNGVEVKVDSVFYTDNKAERSATLVVGKDAVKTYKDGDAYIGENQDTPMWVWNIGNLGVSGTSNPNTNLTTGDGTGPFLGLNNDFVWNDFSDNPPGVGKCIKLPNNYVQLCLDSLTVKDDDYMSFTAKYDSSTDLSDVLPNVSSAKAIAIEVDNTEGILLTQTAKSGVLFNETNEKKTNRLWFSIGNGLDNWDGRSRGTTNRTYGLFYRDTSNNKVRLWGWYNLSTETASGSNPTYKFGEINYRDTKGTDINLEFRGGGNDTVLTVNGGRFIQLRLVPYQSTDLPDYKDNLTANFSLAAATNLPVALGNTLTTEEADELVWAGPTVTNIGTKNLDIRNQYGIIIYNPKSNGASDRVKLSIPGDQVQANVVVKSTGAVASTSGGETCTAADITTVTKKDTEVTDPTRYNLILVGGPCADPLVEKFGVTCRGWSLKEGEAMIKLVENGDKVALIVAGSEALDTRRAAKALANYKDYATKFKGTEVLVKGTTLSDITVQ